MSKRNIQAVFMTAFFTIGLSCLLFLSSCNQAGKNSNNQSAADSIAVTVDTADLATLNMMIRRDPTEAMLFYRRARIFSNQQNFREALNDISIALSLDSLNPDFYIDQAEYFIYNGQPNDAKNSLAKCLELNPSNTDVLLKQAEIHLYLKEYAKAQIVLRDVMKIDDDIAQIYFLQGLVALENGDSVMAGRNMQTAISKDPDFYAAYIQAGKIYSGMQDSLAPQYFQSAIELEPESYEARYNLGLYYQDQGMVEKANEQYDFIIEHIDSTIANPYYNKGYLQLIYTGDFKDAKKWFEVAIAKEPNYADAWYNHGLCNELMAAYKEAREDYQHVLSIAPNYPLAIKGLNRLDEGNPIKAK